MRKLLLATTALVGGIAIAGAAHAQSMDNAAAPITLNVGGYVDFIAGFYQESGVPNNTADAEGSKTTRSGHDFETEFKLNFDATGKANNGVEYGANVSLWNGAEVTNNNYWNTSTTGGGDGPQTPFAGGTNQVTVNSAYVWMASDFGKLLLGDVHGATDLFVYAPTVGEGQIDGRYMDFTDPTTLARFQPSGIDNTEHSTNITYYTPKVGNDDNKVQLGITYEPNMYDYGQNVIKYGTSGGNANDIAYSPYQDVVKGGLQYTGNFNPVNVVLSGQILNGYGSNAPLNTTALGLNGPGAGGTNGNRARDFTAWGLGGQVAYSGFTVGGSYTDMGSYMTSWGQDNPQQVWTLGGKYEMDKLAVAANWLTGTGYDNMLGTYVSGATNQANYVNAFNAYGLGAAYTWFPGLTSNIDGVLFTQSVRSVPSNQDDGYVILVSQKMTF